MSSDVVSYTRVTRSEKKESAALEGVNGPVGIRNGIQLVNWAVDQNTVIVLLNRIPSTAGGALFASGPTRFKQTRNGFCDPPLSDAIRRFQEANGLKADGVVDPGGVTAARMRTLATGVLPQAGGAPDESKLIDNVQQLIDGLQLLGQRLTGIRGTEFRGLAVELEGLLARSGTPRRPQQLPVRNAAVLIEVVVVVVAVCGLIIIAIQTRQSNPTTQKNDKGLVDAIVEGINVRVQRAQQLLLGLLFTLSSALADGLSKLNQLANKIVKTTKSCGDQFEKFEDTTTKLVYALSFPDKNLPGKNKAGDPPDMIKLARQWLQDIMDLIGCLEEKGFPLIQLLNKPTEVGYSLIRLLEKLITGNLGNAVRLVR